MQPRASTVLILCCFLLAIALWVNQWSARVYANLIAIEAVFADLKHPKIAQLDYAIVLGEKALARLPKDASLRRLLGYLYLQRHQPQQAIEILGSRGADYREGIIRYLFGKALLTSGDLEGAIRVWRTVANLDQYFAFLGDVAFEQKNKHEALRFYDLSWQIASTTSSRKVTMFLNLCREYRNLQETEAAAYWCEQAVRSRDDYWTKVELGRTYFEAKQYKLAESTLRSAILLAPEKGSGYHWLGLTLRRLGFIQESLEKLHKSVYFDPTNYWARIDLADALASNGEYDKAACEYRKAQELLSQSDRVELLQKIHEKIAALPLSTDNLPRCGD